MKPEILYNKLYNWILTVGPKILVAIVVLFIGFWLIRLFKKWLRHRMHRREIEHSFQPFLISLIVTAMQVLLLLTAMQIMGIQMTLFTALIGAFGVAAGLALSGTLQNFTSGILILLLKPYRVGDNVIAQGQDGIVSSIQLFYTVLITRDNRTVIIPNSKLSNEVIINLSKLGKRRLDVEFKFNYGFDFEQIKGIILDTLKRHPIIENDPAPMVGVSSVDPDGFKVTVNSWVDALEFEEKKYEVQHQLVNDLKKAGVKLPGMQ